VIAELAMTTQDGSRIRILTQLGGPQTEVPGPGAGTSPERWSGPGSAVTAFKPGNEVYGSGHGGFAVQIARHLGVTVTGVCSTRHEDVVRRPASCREPSPLAGHVAGRVARLHH
jgi:hypothetical protein